MLIMKTVCAFLFLVSLQGKYKTCQYLFNFNVYMCMLYGQNYQARYIYDNGAELLFLSKSERIR